ncbi:hypothetical protein EsH8_VII_000214 [Colletotrichum jinshuiense]
MDANPQKQQHSPDPVIERYLDSKDGVGRYVVGTRVPWRKRTEHLILPSSISGCLISLALHHANKTTRQRGTRPPNLNSSSTTTTSTNLCESAA